VSEPITAEWLKSVGFRWHQFDRQPDKHWLLWLGGAIEDRMGDYEDLGIELAPGGYHSGWYCWLRADTSGRYHRFLHVRHLHTTADVEQLVAALTGQSWDPNNHLHGSAHTPKRAEWLRRDMERLDHRIREGNHKWAEVEKDDSRGRALPEHMQAAINGGLAK